MASTNRRRRLFTAAFTAVTAAAACLVMGTPAQAATPYRFTLCSDGYYTSYAVFTASHSSTKLVDPGTCTTVVLGNQSKDLVELYQSNGRYIGFFSFNDAAGVGVSTTGTASAAGFYLW